MAKGYQKLLERALKDAKWQLKRQPSGSHAVWQSPDGTRTVPVPHRVYDRNMAKSIAKQAGLGGVVP